MTEFATIKANELEFGNHSFVNVGLKAAISADSRTLFASILRGYVAGDGKRRIKSTITFPFDPAVLRWVAEQLEALAVSAEATHDVAPEIVRGDLLGDL